MSSRNMCEMFPARHADKFNADLSPWDGPVSSNLEEKVQRVVAAEKALKKADLRDWGVLAKAVTESNEAAAELEAIEVAEDIFWAKAKVDKLVNENDQVDDDDWDWDVQYDLFQEMIDRSKK